MAAFSEESLTDEESRSDAAPQHQVSSSSGQVSLSSPSVRSPPPPVLITRDAELKRSVHYLEFPLV